MATKLQTILGVIQTVKSTTQKRLDTAYKEMQRPKELFYGLAREYTPREEGGETLPAETQVIQYRVPELLADAIGPWTRMLDLSATIDKTNGTAAAPLVVNDAEITPPLPAIHLIYLEKQLTNLRTLIAHAPTLDPTKQWQWSRDQDAFVAGPVETTRSKKVPRNHVLAEAVTSPHGVIPAQVQVYQEDVLVGTWKKFDYSGALEVQRKRQLLERVDGLIEAVRVARVKANEAAVVDVKYAEKIFDYVLGGADG